jgi:hypothetical protein
LQLYNCESSGSHTTLTSDQWTINKWNQIPEMQVQFNKSDYMVIRNGPKKDKMSVVGALNQWQFLLKCTKCYDHNSIFLKAEIISFHLMYDVWVCRGGELNVFKLVSDRSSICHKNRNMRYNIMWQLLWNIWL